MTVLLAFDTATEQMNIALSVHGVVTVHEALGGAQASATLIPAVLGLLTAAGLTLRAVDAIGFGRGPGAFTGLRTACSVAQGLAFGADRPVLPLDTLLAVAEDARGAALTGTDADADAGAGAGAATGANPFTVWVAMDARMNEIYAAEYLFDAHGWQVLTAPMLISPQALNQRWQLVAPAHIAGNAVAVFGALLEAPGAVLWPQARPSAVALMAQAQTLWQQGAGLDAAQALPLYLRDKVAQTTVERDAARLAKDALKAALEQGA